MWHKKIQMFYKKKLGGDIAAKLAKLPGTPWESIPEKSTFQDIATVAPEHD